MVSKPMVLAWMLMGLLAYQTYRCETLWRSDVTLWDHAVTLASRKPRVMLNAGVAHSSQGDWAQACRLLRDAATAPRRPSDEWSEHVQMAALMDVAAVQRLAVCP